MKKAPALFIGHGSPMNAIEENEFTRNWEAVAKRFDPPKAILSVSAHWFTNGTRISDAENPKMVYDMYGFPDELYRIVYPAHGAPELARRSAELIGRKSVFDQSWGYDHGTWSVLHRMFPKADIPVFQMSVDRTANAQTHYEIGQKLSTLRNDGVMILGSGNAVHNLAMVDWEMSGGYPFAEVFDHYVVNAVTGRNADHLIHYRKGDNGSEQSFVTPDHYYPLLYAVGASDEEDHIEVFNEKCVMGSMSMMCFLFQSE